MRKVLIIPLYSELAKMHLISEVDPNMKTVKLTNDFRETFKKGTKFHIIAESEFIGVKEFVLLTEDLLRKITISEQELKRNFIFISRKAPDLES